MKSAIRQKIDKKEYRIKISVVTPIKVDNKNEDKKNRMKSGNNVTILCNEVAYALNELHI